MEPIHCLGDSHVSLFTGYERIAPIWPHPAPGLYPLFQAYHLGPVTAHGFSRHGSTTRGREKAEEIAAACIPLGARMLFCMGEIDSRAHFAKQARLRNLPEPEIARECARRYFQAVREVAGPERRPLVFNALPTPVTGTDQTTFGNVGTPADRDPGARAFNAELAGLCAEAGVPFLDIYERLLDPTGRPRPELYFDPIHLRQRALPLVLDALRSFAPETPPFSALKGHLMAETQRLKQEDIFLAAIQRRIAGHPPSGQS